MSQVSILLEEETSRLMRQQAAEFEKKAFAEIKKFADYTVDVIQHQKQANTQHFEKILQQERISKNTLEQTLKQEISDLKETCRNLEFQITSKTHLLNNAIGELEKQKHNLKRTVGMVERLQKQNQHLVRTMEETSSFIETISENNFKQSEIAEGLSEALIINQENMSESLQNIKNRVDEVIENVNPKKQRIY